jgi:hypothetical protein
MASRGLRRFVSEGIDSLLSRGDKSAPAIKAVAPAAVKAEKSLIRRPGRNSGYYPPVQAGSQVLRDMPAMNAEVGSLSTELPKGVPALDATKGGGFSDAMKSLGITPGGVGTAALLGGMGLYSGSQSQKAQEQGQAMTGQQKAIAQPYQMQGRQMSQQALAGDMTPATQQAYKAAQAQIQQNVATSGGVGQQQAGIQLEAFRQQLLQNQYQYGIQVSQIGDNIALGAIQDSMQLNQNLNAISNSFYTNLGSIAAMSMGNYNPMMGMAIQSR